MKWFAFIALGQHFHVHALFADMSLYQVHIYRGICFIAGLKPLEKLHSNGFCQPLQVGLVVDIFLRTASAKPFQWDLRGKNEVQLTH